MPETQPSDVQIDSEEQERHAWWFRLLVYQLTALGAALLWCWFKTLRVETVGAEHDSLRNEQAAVYATWHRGMLYSVYHWRRKRGYMMASASKDGEWAAGLIQRFGNGTVRGSSSRGGRSALNELVTKLSAGDGTSGGFLPDAPRGPARVSKPGIVVLAKRTGLPIVPVAFAAKRSWRLKNWDRTILPKPFSRFVVVYGQPFRVDEDLAGEAFDARREAFDRALNAVTDQADAHFAQG